LRPLVSAIRPSLTGRSGLRGLEPDTIEHVLLAGLPVPDRLVLELAQCLRAEGLNDTAETLEDASDGERSIVALTISDREAILSALEYCPYGLAELRSVLLLEHEWRVAEGLVRHAPPVG
jgi:hypothetical protein